MAQNYKMLRRLSISFLLTYLIIQNLSTQGKKDQFVKSFGMLYQNMLAIVLEFLHAIPWMALKKFIISLLLTNMF
jgi:hypothetical protein